MEFSEFRNMQQDHIYNMSVSANALFRVDVDKDVMWDLYLDSFPPGTNEVYRERREFDCSCCRHFIKRFGNIVAINEDNEIVTIWDFFVNDNKYQIVIEALDNFVKANIVTDVFFTKDKLLATVENRELLESGWVKKWSHFAASLPNKLVTGSHKTIPSLTGEARQTKEVFQRALEEIEPEAVTTVLDLIHENVLYRGMQWQSQLESFQALQTEYNNLEEGSRDNFCWRKSVEVGQSIARIRNHSIGVLLSNLSDNMPVETAVAKYTAIVSPDVYQRVQNTTIRTKSIVDNAEKKIVELGLQDSLARRHAQLSDISVNDVVWLNRDAAKFTAGANGIFDVLRDDIDPNLGSFEHLQGVGIEKFINNILPTTLKLEVLLAPENESNLVSLITAQKSDSKSLFKWNNPFCLAYNGNVADSMRQRVKAAGGNIEGVLRVSLQWNDGDTWNKNDLDLHCIEANGNHIYYPHAGEIATSSGVLDVDIRYPLNGRAAIENISWSNIRRMRSGTYEIFVHNFAHRGGTDGFVSEVEFDDKITRLEYRRDVPHKSQIHVADVILKNGNFEIIPKIGVVSETSNEVWGLKTNRFHPVSTCLYSPNFWQGERKIGNKHYLFMIPDCVNDTQPNGFYNEYLNQELRPHRRVLELLGEKMRVSPADYQLSGLGFSSTLRNSVVFKADNKPIKVVF